MTGRWYSKSLAPDHLIELVELDAKRDTRVQDLSGGQRRRLDLALGLVGDPDVLFLDEPTTGFDPHARRHAWSTIRTLCESGKTVFLTTHFMDEAQYLADRVAVMVDGRDRRLWPARGDRWPRRAADRDPLRAARRRRPDGPAAAAGRGDQHQRRHRAHHDRRRRRRRPRDHRLGAAQRGVELESFSVAQPTLEDVYLSLTSPSVPAEHEEAR